MSDPRGDEHNYAGYLEGEEAKQQYQYGYEAGRAEERERCAKALDALEWEQAAMQVAARYGRDGGQRASAAGVNPGCAPSAWGQFMEDLWVEYVTALDEREAIVKWLRDGDRSCDCCGLTREVNHIEGSPIDFDQLCPECHYTKRHLAKSIEDGDHLCGD